MTAAFRRGKVLYGRVPHPDGGSVIRRFARDPKTARGMERMFAELLERGERAILTAVIEKRRTAGQVFDAWRDDPALARFRSELVDVDLEPMVDEYVRVVLVPKFGPMAEQLSSQSGKRAMRQIRTLLPEGQPFPRSALTQQAIERWRAGLSCAEPTKLVHWSNVRGFLEWLVARGVIERNPMDRLNAPKPGKARTRYLDLSDALRLADAQPEPFRSMSALAACGVEFAALFNATRRDVDVTARTFHAHGTKTKARDRICTIPEWAWPYVERAIQGKHPSAPLFRVPVEGVERPSERQERMKLYKATSRSHHRACKALGIADYRFHDGRHTYAVRLKKAGAPSAVPAQQLGHVNTRQVDEVYGVFTPTADEARRWELAAQEREKAQDMEKSATNPLQRGAK